MSTKYRVYLNEEQRQHLLERIGRGESPAREQRRCRILLKSDESDDGPAWPDARIAEAFDVSTVTVASVRKRFCTSGLARAVERKQPDRQYECKLDGEKEARLIQLACSKAPDGHGKWSLRLLAGRMVELDIVDSICHETVRQTLKKTS